MTDNRDWFGVTGSCAYRVVTSDLHFAQHIARMGMFEKRSGGIPGLIVPLQQVRPGVFRKFARPDPETKGATND